MTAEFHDLEESLKTFLLEANSDSYNSKSANLHKYNNLKVFMDLKKTREPHFVVRVGISESVHRLGNCEKISGGLGSDERYIYRWYEKSAVASALNEAWKAAQRSETVQMVNESD
jgi:hypothetical protein